MSKADQLRALREAKFARRSKPTAGEKIIAGLKEAVEIAQGKRQPARSTIIMVPAGDAAKVLGTKGGKSKSPAKQAASKANGKKGGKPKRNPSA
jgi:hypothetical protein